jgi:hypothetical protein
MVFIQGYLSRGIYPGVFIQDRISPGIVFSSSFFLRQARRLKQRSTANLQRRRRIMRDTDGGRVADAFP